jgi:hypothetical protein
MKSRKPNFLLNKEKKLICLVSLHKIWKSRKPFFSFNKERKPVWCWHLSPSKNVRSHWTCKREIAMKCCYLVSAHFIISHLRWKYFISYYTNGQDSLRRYSVWMASECLCPAWISMVNFHQRRFTYLAEEFWEYNMFQLTVYEFCVLFKYIMANFTLHREKFAIKSAIHRLLPVRVFIFVDL